MLLGLLISAQRMEDPRTAFSTGSADPKDYAALFSKSCERTMVQVKPCGPLLHAVFSNYRLCVNALERTGRWLTNMDVADHDARRRADVAARWVNQGAASADHVRFLFFFFALDALFGQRFQVEERIVEAVKLRMSDAWAEKCR